MNAGEFGFSTDTHQTYIGDGAANHELAKVADAFMDSEFKNQSFQNMLENGGFESWSDGAALAPDGWVLSGNGTIARDAVRKIGTYSATLTSVLDLEAYLQDDTHDLNYLSGRKVTFSGWVKASVADRTRLIIYDNDGSGYAASGSAYHSGGGGWEFLSVTRTLRAGLTALITRFIIDPGAVISASFDGAILVEGSVCPAFSPKPAIYEDGVPSGLISMWHGLIANIPAGWLICDGLNSTPDLRSRFIRGAPAATEAGGVGGADTHTLVTAEMPVHRHTSTVILDGSVLASGTGKAPSSAQSGNTGGGGAHNNMPAYYQILFIMKT